MVMRTSSSSSGLLLVVKASRLTAAGDTGLKTAFLAMVEETEDRERETQTQQQVVIHQYPS